jgi:hypothetical protein
MSIQYFRQPDKEFIQKLMLDESEFGMEVEDELEQNLVVENENNDIKKLSKHVEDLELRYRVIEKNIQFNRERIMYKLNNIKNLEMKISQDKTSLGSVNSMIEKLKLDLEIIKKREEQQERFQEIQKNKMLLQIINDLSDIRTQFPMAVMYLLENKYHGSLEDLIKYYMIGNPNICFPELEQKIVQNARELKSKKLYEKSSHEINKQSELLPKSNLIYVPRFFDQTIWDSYTAKK